MRAQIGHIRKHKAFFAQPNAPFKGIMRIFRVEPRSVLKGRFVVKGDLTATFRTAMLAFEIIENQELPARPAECRRIKNRAEIRHPSSGINISRAESACALSTEYRSHGMHSLVNISKNGSAVRSPLRHHLRHDRLEELCLHLLPLSDLCFEVVAE